jgi:hypothetical protein
MGRSKPFVLAIAGVPLNGTVITGNFVTDPIKVGGGPFSASVRITGGGTGTFKIQWTDADIGAVTEDDWEDEANSTETGAARASWLAVAPPYNLARVVYTHGSGSRTMYGKATAKGS